MKRAKYISKWNITNHLADSSDTSSHITSHQCNQEKAIKENESSILNQLDYELIKVLRAAGL